MRLVEPGRSADLLPEPGVEDLVVSTIRGQHLQSHHPVDGGVEGPPHVSHAAAAQQFHQSVASELGSVHVSLPGVVHRNDSLGYFLTRPAGS